MNLKLMKTHLYFLYKENSSRMLLMAFIPLFDILFQEVYNISSFVYTNQINDNWFNVFSDLVNKYFGIEYGNIEISKLEYIVDMIIGYIFLMLDIVLFYIASFVYDFCNVYEVILSSFNYRGSSKSIFVIYSSK